MAIVFFSISFYNFQDIHCQNLYDVTPLELVTVKCKYASRNPMYDFSYIVNTNLYQTCHRLRDNRMNLQNIADFNIQTWNRVYVMRNDDDDYTLDSKLIHLQFVFVVNKGVVP